MGESMSMQVYGALNDGYRNLYYTYKEALKDNAAFYKVV